MDKVSVQILIFIGMTIGFIAATMNFINDQIATGTVFTVLTIIFLLLMLNTRD